MKNLVVWITAVFALAMLGIILTVKLVKTSRDMASLEKQRQESMTAVADALRQVMDAKGELDRVKSQIGTLEQEKTAVVRTRDSLEQELRGTLKDKDLVISELQGKLTVNILDRVLFTPGEAALKPEGETVLRQIAGVLARYPDRQVLVSGHTDNLPFKAAKPKFASNWELSVARATAAVRFLSEKAGVNPRRLAAVGYGEFHPVAENATAAGRARNRRIELVILAREILPPRSAVAPVAVVPSVAPVPAPTPIR